MASSDNHPPFERLLNFRDVGESINRYAGRPCLKTGLLYRSARPDEATPVDRHRLVEDYNLKTIIDLRTSSEHIQQTRKLASKIPSAPAVSPSDPAEPVKIPGIKYEEINFNGSAYSKALIKQLTYGQTAKLAGLYVFGYRNEAISVLGTNVMAKRGLIGLAEDSLTHCTAEVKSIFDILANRDAYPLLVHCTQGKDRTGITVLLVCMLLGAPTEAIKKDYVLSGRELAPERAEKLAEIRGIGLPDSFADCPENWVETVSRFIDENHGGVEQYLKHCGVTEQQIAATRKLYTP